MWAFMILQFAMETGMEASSDTSNGEFIFQPDDDELGHVSSSDQGVPWHHVQLYRLYGKEADYFLHPKLLSEKHTGTLNANGQSVIRGRNSGEMFIKLIVDLILQLAECTVATAFRDSHLKLLLIYEIII
jgi:hypothetical protein